MLKRKRQKKIFHTDINQKKVRVSIKYQRKYILGQRILIGIKQLIS